MPQPRCDGSLSARKVKPCKSVNLLAKSLVIHLGFSNALHELAAASTNKGTEDTEEFQKLAID
jgi:hypothetical protein